MIDDDQSVSYLEDAEESDVVFDSYRLRSDSFISVDSSVSNRAEGVVEPLADELDGVPKSNVDEIDGKWVPLGLDVDSKSPMTRAAAFLRVGTFETLGATNFQFVVEKAPLLGDAVLYYRDLLGTQDLRCEVVDGDGTLVLYDECSGDPLLVGVMQREKTCTAYQFVDMRRGRFNGVFRYTIDALSMHVSVTHPDYVFEWNSDKTELVGYKRKLQLGRERVNELHFDVKTMKVTIHPEYNVAMWSMIVMCWKQTKRNL